MVWLRGRFFFADVREREQPERHLEEVRTERERGPDTDRAFCEKEGRSSEWRNREKQEEGIETGAWRD